MTTFMNKIQNKMCILMWKIFSKIDIVHSLQNRNSPGEYELISAVQKKNEERKFIFCSL